jgi:hypothetical protein
VRKIKAAPDGEASRAWMEEAAATERLRPLPTKFAIAVESATGHSVTGLREAETKRLRDERAGRQTKPFGEMNRLEIIQAMSSYSSRAMYPDELDAEIERLAALPPPPPLNTADRRALMEVLSIREQLPGSANTRDLAARLFALAMHRHPIVQTAAQRVVVEILFPPEQMRLPGDEDPIKKLVEGTVPKGKGRGPGGN